MAYQECIGGCKLRKIVRFVKPDKQHRKTRHNSKDNVDPVLAVSNLASKYYQVGAPIQRIYDLSANVPIREPVMDGADDDRRKGEDLEVIN